MWQGFLHGACPSCWWRRGRGSSAAGDLVLGTAWPPPPDNPRESRAAVADGYSERPVAGVLISAQPPSSSPSRTMSSGMWSLSAEIRTRWLRSRSRSRRCRTGLRGNGGPPRGVEAGGDGRDTSWDRGNEDNLSRKQIFVFQGLTEFGDGSAGFQSNKLGCELRRGERRLIP